jgi:hypothetical protein
MNKLKCAKGTIDHFSFAGVVANTTNGVAEKLNSKIPPYNKYVKAG